MPDQPAPHLRFQFSLRTLMIGVTLLAVPLGYVGWQAKIVRERKAMLSHIWKVNRRALWSETRMSVPWVRRLLGDYPVRLIELPRHADLEEPQQIQALFPEATIREFEEDEVSRPATQ
jgi:hypothetical protein